MVMIHQPRSYVGVDRQDGPGVDRLVDCEHLTDVFDSNCADVIVCTEMMEHADDWRACVREMVAALRPGGVLLLTTRSVGFAYHEPPDNWRYTQAAFLEILTRANLEPQVVCADPEMPGVFVRARKPEAWSGWLNPDLDDVEGVTPVKEPLKILGLPANADGCGYYRFWQPYKQLTEKSGHLVAIPYPQNVPYDPTLPEVEEMDVVAQQRPHGERGLKEWTRWKGRTKLVYESDDNVSDADTNLPHWQTPRMVNTTTECARLADLVTVSTEPLAERLRRVNDNVLVIPNYVHEDLLRFERPHRDKTTICWAGGATHLQDLAMVQQPLNGVLDTTDADIHFIGEDFRSLFGHRGRFTPFHQSVWSYYGNIDGDLAIIPLRETEFNRARSYIKALEYAALGIPVVASNIEPYRDFVVDGVTGYLANTEAQWSMRVAELVRDPQMCGEMGLKAKELARGYTIQQHWPKWVDAYEGVVNG
jgi:hypothetical protein